MRVLLVINARLPTTAAHGHQTVRMGEAFAALGHQVEVWHPRRRQPAAVGDAVGVHEYYEVPASFAVRTLPNIDVVVLEPVLGDRLFPRVFAAHALAWGLGAALAARRADPDLVYTRDPETAYWSAALGVPTAWEAHATLGPLRRRLVAAAARRPAFRAALPLTTPLAQDLVRAGVPADKVTVLPSGVDLARFDALPDRDACRAVLGLQPGRPTVGFVGRFEAFGGGRGVGALVRAVADAQRRHGVEADLVCIGGPAEAVPRLVAVARSVGLDDSRVRFVDRVPPVEAARWARAVDVAVMPYPALDHFVTSASPLKLFEYMAAGTPIVASDLAGVRDVVAHGRQAWLVPPDDVRALADGIATLLGDPLLAARLARAGAETVRAHSWEARAARALDAAEAGQATE